MSSPAEFEDARREHIRAIRAKHYAKYAERYRAYAKAWRKANPDKVRANNLARKPRKTDRRVRNKETDT